MLAGCRRIGIPPPTQENTPAASSTLEPTSAGTTAIVSPTDHLILDAHEDIAWNAIEFGRDPLQSALESRASEAQNGIAGSFGERATGLPQWIAGRVGIIFATIYVEPSWRNSGRPVRLGYSTPAEARTAAIQELDFYRSLAEKSEQLRLVTDRDGLDRVLASWKKSSQPQVGLVLLMEGAEPIQDPDELADWQQSGLRIIGPAWAKTRYAGANGEPGPLTESGYRLLAEMARLNMILDISHLSETACLETLDAYNGPLLASHSNPRKFLPTERGLTDEMILKLAAKDGAVGIVPTNNYLKPGWRYGDPKQSLAVVVDAIDYVAQLTGSAAHVGLGTDFDGGFGPGALPEGIDTIADLPKIATALSDYGWKDKDIRSVMAENFLRVLRKGLG